MFKKSLSLLMVAGLIVGTQVKAGGDTTTKTAMQFGTLGGMAICGYFGEKLNDPATPTWQADVLKAGLGVAALAVLRYQTEGFNANVFKSDLIKMAMIAGVHLTLNNELTYEALHKIPIINGLFTDAQVGADANKKERSGIGRLARCILGYMVLREGAKALGLIVE